MHRYFAFWALSVAVSILVSTPLATADDIPEEASKASAAEKSKQKPTQEELEQSFAELLTGATLEGSFTTDGAESAEPPKPDRYQLGEVKKLKNDFWSFAARVQYNGRDTEVRLPLEVKWAGDTPVITVTNVLFPGLGVFTARVMFYGDRYAGTWQGSDHGGTMFGRVIRPDVDEKADAESSTDDKDTKSDKP